MQQNTARKYHAVMIILLFLAASIAHFLFANYYKVIYIYPDELRYYDIARSIWKNHTISILNNSTDFQKILYSLIISPAFAYSDVRMQQIAIAGINSFVVCSGVFPVYLISRQFLRSDKRVIYVCVLYLLFSDLTYVCTFMSENLYIPMGLWAVYLLILECERLEYPGNNPLKDVLKCWGTGVYLWLLYLCKEIGAAFLIGYIFYILCLFIRQKKFNGMMMHHALAMILGFVTPFAFSKLTIYRGLGNSYHQQNIGIMTDVGNFFYGDYGIFYYLFMILAAYTPFVLIIPLLSRKQLSKKIRHFYYYLAIVLFISVAAIAYTITIREDSWMTNPRLHLRYLGCLYLPFVIAFLSSTESEINIPAKKLAVGVFGTIAWLAYFLVLYPHIIIDNSVTVDQTTLRFLSDNNSTAYQFGSLLLYASIMAIIFIVFLRNKRMAYRMIAGVLLLINIINSVFMIKTWHAENAATDTEINEINYFSDFDRKHSAASVVVIDGGSVPAASLSMSLQNSDSYFLSYASVYNIREHVNEGSKWNDYVDRFEIPRMGNHYKEIEGADYIIVTKREYLTIEDVNCELIDTIGDMDIYKNNAPAYIPNMTYKNAVLYTNS